MIAKKIDYLNTMPPKKTSHSTYVSSGGPNRAGYNVLDAMAEDTVILPNVRESYRDETPPISLFGYKTLDTKISNLEDRIEKVEEVIKSTNSIKIYDLASTEFNLKEPIDTLIKTTKDGVLAIFPDLELYGEGDNEIEALRDLKLELIEFFEDLNETPDENLSEKFLTWKKTINWLLQKNESK